MGLSGDGSRLSQTSAIQQASSRLRSYAPAPGSAGIFGSDRGRCQEHGSVRARDIGSRLVWYPARGSGTSSRRRGGGFSRMKVSRQSGLTGVAYAAAAYLTWGLFPFYFRALGGVPAPEILAHRILWSGIFMTLLITGRRR